MKGYDRLKEKKQKKVFLVTSREDYDWLRFAWLCSHPFLHCSHAALSARGTGSGRSQRHEGAQPMTSWVELTALRSIGREQKEF